MLYQLVKSGLLSLADIRNWNCEINSGVGSVQGTSNKLESLLNGQVVVIQEILEYGEVSRRISISEIQVSK